jgi:hypothetical protein
VLKKTFSVSMRKRDGTSQLLRNVFGTPKVGAVIKIPVGNGGGFFGIEITAEPPSPDKPVEAKELASVDPDDPAFDPKNELMDFIRLAVGPDSEEKRYIPTSKELTSFFTDQKISPTVAEFISSAVVRHCVSLFPRRKKGRPSRPPWEKMDSHAEELARIKQVLRARGEKGSVHKKAMQILQNNYEELRQGLPPDERPYLPPFPYDALEHYVRRSKKRSTK